ncbi:MaoC family dehydratase [Rhodovibrio salinarum]|uniref:Acyl dehydratase n=1 Tax=Rhodovibrio salinarum TaxID=1087 RepID=A0A934V086_9PROT|nr:MaoC family dehydratase [Rhodovibrio salinarum]MBK1697165.1 acyl dehydratase [Rhodovibrio salinarum]
MSIEQPLYFEDFTVGRRFTTRGVTLTEADIIDFAFKYDPQPFHIDKVAAEQSPYGGLIASGFHTLSVCFRMAIQAEVFTACSMGSPGLDELRWLQPVRPGDTLCTEFEVVHAEPSQSRSSRGRVRIAYTMKNQRGETVMTVTANQILRTRKGAESAQGSTA